MDLVWALIVVGLTTGAVYGLAGTGLVLTYKTSGIFNFGHGALATASAYVFYWLHVDHEVAWPLAGLVSVVLLGPLMGLIMERLALAFARVTVAMQIVGTVGVVLLIQGLATIKYGDATRPFPPFLPTNTFRVAGIYVGYDQVIITAVGIAAVVLLYGLFRFTRVGVAMRGVVDNPGLLDVSGTNPDAVRRYSWLIGATFAALSGVLLAPSLSLDAIFLTLLVVQAFGAAAIGMFSNLPLTYLGGSIIGVAAALSTKYVIDFPWLGGFPVSLPFIVLFVVLLATPRRKLASARVVSVRPHVHLTAPVRVRLITAVLVLGFLILLPNLVGAKLPVYMSGLALTILMLSLALLMKTSGQVSLCHVTFAGVGAAAFSHFAVGFHIPWLVALLMAGLVVVPLGAIVAIPAIRLSTLFLAIATFGFGILVEHLFFSAGYLFGVTSDGLKMPRPVVAGVQLTSDFRFYYVLLALVVVTAVAVVAINASRLGRLLRGMADSPVALTTHGLSVRTTRVIVFCISAFLAGVAGALMGCAVTFATAEAYPSFNSLIYVAILGLVPFIAPWNAMAAAIPYSIIPAYIGATGSGQTLHYLTAIFGFFAIAHGAMGGPIAAPAFMRRVFDRWGKPAPAWGAEPTEPAPAARPAVARLAGRSGWEIEGLRVRFGGHQVVAGVSLRAPVATITGLIGPNGAGKTTTFNAVSGLLRPSAGTIRLHGQDISRLSPAARARRGLGRTFQTMELFDSLTVAENVALGREAFLAGGNAVTQVFGRPGDRASIDAAVAAALELVEIRPLLDARAGDLSTGQRRLVELAGCLAGDFSLLLLDEPSSGLDRRETEAFSEVLKRVVAERGVGILLVEHNMSIVMGVCEHIYVLDFGVPIFEGSPEEVEASDRVRAVYLGEKRVAAAPVLDEVAT